MTWKASFRRNPPPTNPTSPISNLQIAIYRAVAYGIVGAAIGRPPTNCNAICWFSAGKQSVIALRRCDFVKQNHADERHPRVASLAPLGQFTFCSPLRCLTKLPDKRELAQFSFRFSICPDWITGGFGSLISQGMVLSSSFILIRRLLSALVFPKAAKTSRRKRKSTAAK